MATELDVTMELEEHVNQRFMAKFPRYEPKIKDSSAIREFKTCPRLYFYRIVLGRIPRDEPPYFAWGSSYHKFREVLERSYGYGESTPTVLDIEKAKLAFATAAEAGLAVWKKKGRDQEAGTKWEFMTSARLLSSFQTAFNHWLTEKKQGKIKVIAVEQSFNLPIGSRRTSGRADQIVRWNGRLWGRDFKTSSKDEVFFARGLEPNDQFTRYTYAEGQLAGEQIQGQIVEVLFNAKPTKQDTKGPRIMVFTTSRTQWQVDQFVGMNEQTEEMIDLCRETDIWPQFEIACSFCAYHSVCKQVGEAAMMAQLEGHYRLEPWDNTKVGVD